MLAEGHMLKTAAEAVKRLEKDGYQPMLVNMRFISPLDGEMLLRAAEQCAYIFTVEDNLGKGGLGSRVLEFYSGRRQTVSVTSFAFPDCYIEQGTQAQLFARHGLDAEGIYKGIKKRLGD